MLGSIRAYARENTAERRRERRRQLAFDRQYGIDTATPVSASALSPHDPHSAAAIHAVAYQPTSIEAFNGMLGAIPIAHERFAFIDIGSGKGRALLLSSHYPFRKIIGVEFSPRLARIAVRNIAQYRHPEQKCADIQSVCIDAAQYPLPSGQDLLLYLYNPFGEPIMKAFLENVRRAAQEDGRDIWLVYLNPILRELFDQAPFLTPVVNDAGLCLYRTTRIA